MPNKTHRAPPRYKISDFFRSLLGLAVGAHMADFFSNTHIFNDRWPPHAKFHTGQTLSMSILLGVMSVFFAWRKTADNKTNGLCRSRIRGPLLDNASNSHPLSEHSFL
jgi:hypothetical protein